MTGESSQSGPGSYTHGDHYEKENKMKNKIKGAMIYPMVLGILTVAVVILMLVVVLPSFIGVIESGGGEIPLPTRILLDLSGFIQRFWWLLGGVIILWLSVGAALSAARRHLWWMGSSSICRSSANHCA